MSHSETTTVRDILTQNIARWTLGHDELATAIPNLLLHRREAPTQRSSCMVEPSVGFVIQGSMRAVIGEDVLVNDNNRFLIASVEMPVMIQIVDASPDVPYLGLALKLDLRVLADVMVQSRLSPPREQSAGYGIVLGDTTPELLDAFMRLLKLLDEPAAIPVLAPLIQREIYYRLLLSTQAARLWQIVQAGSQSHRIMRAIDWLKSNHTQTLRIDELAAHVQMSPSSFHHHFRQLTGMTPLQFQKWLRLNEARRLMLTHRIDASSAAFQVGYESPSQFSREYSRLFGTSPRRDINNLRHASPIDLQH